MTELIMHERPFSFRQLNKIIRKINLSDNNIVLIKYGTALAKIDNLKRFTYAIEEAGFNNVIVAVADDLDDLSVLDESKMNKAGWYYMRKAKKSS